MTGKRRRTLDTAGELDKLASAFNYEEDFVAGMASNVIDEGEDSEGALQRM